MANLQVLSIKLVVLVGARIWHAAYSFSFLSFHEETFVDGLLIIDCLGVLTLNTLRSRY